MRIIRRNVLRSLAFCISVITIILLFLPTTPKINLEDDKIISVNNLKNTYKNLNNISTPNTLAINEASIECLPNILELDNHQSLLELAKKNKHKPCDQKDWIKIDSDGTVRYNKEYLKENNIIIKDCKYSVISWDKNDFTYKLSNAVNISDGEKLDVKEEFFEFKCTSLNEAVYTAQHARIFQQKNLNDTLKRKNIQPINIMMIGLDSVSRYLWLSKLPSFSEYFQNEMKAKVLKGYNIVGDGTPAALIPILTAMHEEELPNTIKKTPNARHVDEVYPFIWKNFTEKLNYASLFNEDWPSVGTFQYRMIGFKSPSTTHYMRPFQIANEKRPDKFCEGSRDSMQLNLDYLEDFMRLYKDRGFFSFSHINKYSHNSSKKISWLDETLLAFLKRFHADKSLSGNTLLFFFSDHGPRFSQERKSIKGLLHERNPFFSMYVPELFQQRYPNEFASLNKNLDKVTTPMDIHATLMNILKLEDGSIKPKTNTDHTINRGISLFSDISPNRTCENAGIKSYWCSCLKRKKIPIDAYARNLTNTFVNYINNNVLKNRLDLCHKLEIDTVDHAYLTSSSLNATQKLNKPKDHLKLNLLRAPSVSFGYKQYLFVVTTKPNGGEYEFTLNVESKLDDPKADEKIQIDKSLISRINKYGNAPHCIHDTFPDLRKYCYCKKGI